MNTSRQHTHDPVFGEHVDSANVQHAEHSRTYRWERRRPGRRVHVLNPETGHVWCKLENMQRKRAFDSEGTAKPPGRKTCKNCLDLAERAAGGHPKNNGQPVYSSEYQEPSLGVLLGERLAEEGPDLGP